MSTAKIIVKKIGVKALGICKNAMSSVHSFLIKLRRYLIVSVLSMIFASIVTIRIMNELQPVADKSETVKVTNTSGSPLTVNSIYTKNKTTTISTSYDGAGTSDISIPNKLNPSANYWDNHHWAVGGMVSTNLTYSLIGSYRYDRIVGLGSVWFKNLNGYEFGLSIGAMYTL